MFTVYNEEKDRFDLVEEPDQSLTYTYADYLQWKFEERVELFRGKIMKMSPAPNRLHQEILGRLHLPIATFLKHKDYKSFLTPFDVRLPVKNKKKDHEVTTVVQPDLCIICDASKLDERGCIGAPDLVIEILSPGNSKKEVRIKHELYEEAGVKEYWLVYPAEESIAVFLLNPEGKYDGAKLYAGSEHITSVAVPGLTIDTTEIF